MNVRATPIAVLLLLTSACGEHLVSLPDVSDEAGSESDGSDTDDPADVTPLPDEPVDDPCCLCDVDDDLVCVPYADPQTWMCPAPYSATLIACG